MAPLAATIIFAFGILGLFWLDRTPRAKRSWTLLLPAIWLLISGSRHVSEWFDVPPSDPQQRYLDGSPFDATIYGLLIGAAMIVLFGRRQIVGKLLRKNWPILLFVLYCAVSIAWSDYPDVALKRWIKSLGDYAMVLILLTEVDPIHALKQVLARAAFLLMPLSILFIKYYPQLGRTYAEHWDATQFLVGVTDNKNMLGMVCMVFGFAAMWRVLQAWQGPRQKRAKTLIVHGTILAMAAWLLILCDSKTSLSCLVLAATLVALHTFFKSARKRAVISVMLVVVFLTCSSVLLLGIGGDALQTMGRDSSLTGRTDIWKILLTVPVNPLVGTGFESFWLGKRLEYLWTFSIMHGLNEAHNGYLEVYLNLGWIGLGLLGVLLWTGYRNILRVLERDPEAGRLRLGYFVIAVVYNLTEAGIRTTDLVWISFLLAIIALPQRRLAPAAAANVSRGLTIPVAAQPVPWQIAPNASRSQSQGIAPGAGGNGNVWRTISE